jgi:hypothetical protein
MELSLILNFFSLALSLILFSLLSFPLFAFLFFHFYFITLIHSSCLLSYLILSYLIPYHIYHITSYHVISNHLILSYYLIRLTHFFKLGTLLVLLPLFPIRNSISFSICITDKHEVGESLAKCLFSDSFHR